MGVGSRMPALKQGSGSSGEHEGISLLGSRRARKGEPATIARSLLATTARDHSQSSSVTGSTLIQTTYEAARRQISISRSRICLNEEQGYMQILKAGKLAGNKKAGPLLARL